MGQTKSIEVRDLVPGMILAFTYHEVLTHPVSLYKDNKGKIDFAVKTNQGEIIQKSWHKFALVNIIQKNNRGGARRGAGRKPKEPTVVIRIPKSKIEQIKKIIGK